MSKIKVLIIMIALLLPYSAKAATNYVDGTLAEDCDGTKYYYDVSTRTRKTGSGQIAWNDLASANSTLTAGDTVYIRGDTEDYQEYIVGYNVWLKSGDGEGIFPRNSGTAGNYITYSVYPGEKVHLVGSADDGSTMCIGIWIKGQNYIKVTGISEYNLKVSKMTHNVCIGERSGQTPGDPSNYNEICYVWATNTYRSEDWRALWQGNAVWKGAQYNHIHHCKFTYHGYLGNYVSANEGDLFSVGVDSAYTGSDDHYNVIEDCEFAYAGHGTFTLNTAKYTVVRNNYMHNEEWFEYEGNYYSYRNIIAAGTYGNAGWNIFENNKIGHAGPNINTIAGIGGTGTKWALSDSIMRYNSFFNNYSCSFSFNPGYKDTITNKNYFYNNTFYHNGHYYKYPAIVFVYNGGSTLWDKVNSNVLKNNLFYDEYKHSIDDDVYSASAGNMTDCQGCGENQGCNKIENNFNDWDNSDGDPLFVDKSLTLSGAHPNLQLQANSPALNKGKHLTVATRAGSSSTTLIVDDAHYFQDGKFGSDSGCDPAKWPPNVNMQADWIAIGTVDKVVQIKSINYNTNTINLASSMTWSDNAKVWLYKISDGSQVLKSGAPDMGCGVVYKPPTSSSAPDIPAVPTNLRIVE